MITISEHKKILEAKGINLTDENLGKLLELQYKLANVFFDIWIKQTQSIFISIEIIAHIAHTKEDRCDFCEDFILKFQYSYA